MKSILLKTIACLFTISLFVCCTEDLADSKESIDNRYSKDVIDAPEFGVASEIVATYEEATFELFLKDKENVIEQGAEISTNENMEEAVILKYEKIAETVSMTIGELEPLTTYYVRPYIVLANYQPVYGETISFTTEDLPKWNDKWIGDYTYTQFFGDYDEETDNTYPVVEEGLICQQSAVESEQFKITNWGFGTDFLFTFTEGGDVEVAYQPIGYEEEGYGPVYVTDLAAYIESDSMGKSSYDPETGTFTFVVYYPIVGTNYSYGYGEEYYEITDNAVKARVDAAYYAAKSRAPKKVKKTKKFAQVGVNISNASPIYKHFLLKNLTLK